MGSFHEFDPNKLEITSKAVSPDYHPEPFYLVQASETGAVRMPCWSADPAPLFEIILGILKTFPEEVEMLIKAKTESHVADSNEPDEWIRFHGHSSNRVVQSSLTRFYKFLACDSTHQFMARNTETDEYFCFDDYGILWIYSEDEKFKKQLGARGFKEKNGQPLIYEGPVWRLTAPNSQGQLKELVDFLMLSEVKKSEHENPPELIQ